ncbi:FAD-dependent oxidoreductase [Specibacter sp. RAF43]|uniref:FAD-dependent oxidoreductase n=1 Tax=Specibacter sp. RAF43 TaxID=3233057 RepID=UPI003F949DCC
MPDHTMETECCIAGGGPAGMMLGLLLARAGVEVLVLEKHGDFLRDFRGDTIHPSTLDLLDQLGLRERFLRIPQSSITTLDVVVRGTRLTPVNFGRLRGVNKRLALMPQWDFLELLAGEGRTLPTFRLLMGTEATGLLRRGGAVTGVTARGPDGRLDFGARLTVAADGRTSTLRAAAGLRPDALGVPIDVLWFRLPIPPSPPPDTLGYLRNGTLVITIPRPGYYQMGMLIPKGGFETFRAAGLDAFKARVLANAPFLAPVLGTLTDWEQVKLLSVQLDRLRRWSVPGLLCLGDAAHAMSPVFGVGVNYALQDAVAAARYLAPGLRDGTLTERDVRRVQRRRQWPVRLMQPLQQRVHGLLSTADTAGTAPMSPWQQHAATLAATCARPLLSRLVGRGFLPEKLTADPARR